MTTRLAGDVDYGSFSPSSSPQGRRYVLKNLNLRKQQQALSYKTRNFSHDYNDEYFDIRTAPSSQGSNASKQSGHIGTANRIMPTDNAVSPRKTPREKPVYVTPRKDVFAKNKSPRKGASTQQEQDTASPRKGNTDKKKVNELTAAKKNENGLTPRDEYMVTKLYDRQIIYLKPSEVRYTHDQITAHFQDGRHLIKTFVALLYGRIEIRLGANDVPPVEVMQTEDNDGTKLWYVVNGNRRLFVFRRLEKCGALTTMQVVARRYDAIEMDKHFLTRNKGRSVTVTNDATFDAKVRKEVTRWKEWKTKQPKQKPPPKGKAQPAKKRAPQNNASSSCCCVS